MSYTCTGIRIPTEDHILLRDAARGRQRALGGRVNASGIIAELIDKHRGELAVDAEKNLPESVTACR